MKPKNELLFLALGGSGEIGMNANLYGCDGKWVLVDLGMTFSDPHYPGVDLIFPDLQFIEERRDDLLGVVLTHGHEDHIGAIPFLAHELCVPLYATPFTAGLIAKKLKESGYEKDVELNVIPNEGSFELGPFGFRYVPLAHSIAEGNGLVIDTPYGRVFHTGDWKLDDRPLLGTPATPEQLTAIGDEGVLALVCDSTNVFNEKGSGSEGDVRDNLLETIGNVKKRALVTTFASNAARLQTLGEVAKLTNRKLCVAGRSLHRILENAQTHGYLKDFPETFDFDDIMKFPRHEVMIVATGGQGEARAALSRIATDSHQIKLDAGDTVLFSSKQIPGNEISIGRIQNALAEKGVLMITERQAHIHVSGHPGKPELAAMYDWIKPEILVPVHGEMRHMMEQARFGEACGVGKTIVQKNGQMIRLAPKGPKLVSHELVGRLLLDGDVILPADGQTLNERRRISIHGQISVAIALNNKDNLYGEPVIRMQGVPIEEDQEAFLDEAIGEIKKTLTKAGHDIENIREKVRIAVRRAANRWTGKKPIVDVLIIEGLNQCR